MEPLLPETAEGSNARARPDEDARMGTVLGELEVTGTEGDRDGRRDALVLRHHGLGAHARQGLGIWRGGMVGRGSVGGAEKIMSQNLIPKSCTLLHTLARHTITSPRGPFEKG